MNNFKKYRSIFLIAFIFILSIKNISAYVQSRTDGDALIHWANGVTALTIFVNPANTQGFPTNIVDSEAAAAMGQWNGKSRITLSKASTAGVDQDGLNEIYFSSDPSIFNGTGVVGITQVSFRNNTGEILEADVLLNDLYTFSSNVTEVAYIGNVIAHELGHFLGLGHSQVAGSTMFYALTRGQSQLADDDKAGVYSIYPTGDSSKSTLSGRIVGGKSLARVFGAHVQAVSLKTGNVAGSTISEIDGTFSIAGLAKNDQYYIYTNPTAQVGLPTRFNYARYDFCTSSKKYRGSFFQSCGSSSEGYPQAVNLTASQMNVGNITIRCGLDVPVDYMQNKNVTPALFDIQSHSPSGVGNTFTGFFSAQEMATPGTADYFKMDFSGINWTNLSATGDLYVELKILNQSFYSPFKANVSIKRDSGTTVISPNYVVESDGGLELDTIKRISINRVTPSDNNFEITITPESLVFPNFPVGLPYAKSDYFPAATYFEDSSYFYLVTASIVKDNGDGTYSHVSSKSVQLSDNTQCPDANNTYALTPFTVKRSAASVSGRRKDGVIACGTVDMSGGPGSGPGGFFIGLILSLILSSLTSSIIKQIRSKHYSKLA